MSRKRRSRSPNMMEEDRYGLHRRSTTLTSNVRGTEDDSDNDDMGTTSSEDDSKPDPNASNDYSMFPANLLAEEKRTSFFKTILNPGGPGGSVNGGSGSTGSDKSVSGGPSTSAERTSRKRDMTNSPEVSASGVAGANGTAEDRSSHYFGKKKPPPTFDDPITIGLITEEEAKTLFEVCVSMFPLLSQTHVILGGEMAVHLYIIHRGLLAAPSKDVHVDHYLRPHPLLFQIFQCFSYLLYLPTHELEKRLVARSSP